jgi:DNA-binding NarL/FixJ family response regulator
MPYLNGLDATRQLLQHDPHFKVIVLTITNSDQVIREALDAGARGFVLKIRRRSRSGGRRLGLAEQANVFHATSKRSVVVGISGEGTCHIPD